MHPFADTIDLDRLGLKSGGGWHGDLLVAVDGFSFGGQGYEPADTPLPVKVEISHTTSGYVVRVRFTTQVEGPCMRCFDDVPFAVDVDSREVHDPQVADELASEWVTDGKFDLAGYVHQAIGLALPPTMSAPLAGDGGCRVCGRSAAQLHELGIGEEPDAQHDPRWAKLRELEL